MQKNTRYTKEIKFEILDIKWGKISVRVHWDDLAYKDFEIFAQDSLVVIPEVNITYSEV